LKYKMELSIINKIARENIVKKLKSGVLRLNNKQLMNFNSSANTT